MSKAERTKQFIIEKTAPVFNAKGFAGTSLNDMINATRLTKGSIYGNFENKDAVALAAFDYNFGCITQYIKSKMAEQNSCVKKLLVYPEIYRNYFSIPFLSAGCPILNTAIEADDTHPLLRAKVNNAITFWKNSVERLISKGIELGEIKAETAIKEFIVILVSLIECAVMQAKVSGKSDALLITMKHLERQILQLKV